MTERTERQSFSLSLSPSFCDEINAEKKTFRWHLKLEGTKKLSSKDEIFII